MKTNELIKQIEGLKIYLNVMTLDDYTRKAIERTISDMQDTLSVMIEHGLFDIKEV